MIWDDETGTMLSAYERGWMDASQGISHNPFRRNTPEWYGWRNGRDELGASVFSRKAEAQELIRLQAH